MRHYYRTGIWAVAFMWAVAASCWTTLQIAGLPHQAHTVALALAAGGFGWVVLFGFVCFAAEYDTAEMDADA